MKKTAVVGQVTHVATRAATHPISTASFVLGVARGFAAGLIRTVADLRSTPTRHDEGAGSAAPPVRVAPDVSDVPDVPDVPAAVQLVPDPPGESFATEPTAVTRTSAHGGGGRDADIDDWFDEARHELEGDDPAADSVVEALQRGDRPGEDQVDRAAVKGVLTEAERLRGIAD